MDHFLKRFCSRHDLVLHKGDNLHILLTLVWDRVLLIKLHLHKWLHGIHHPIVHYYAVCWNEEKILPFMFDYYKQFVDGFTIFDNYSNDHSENIIRSYSNTKIFPFKTDGFNDDAHNDIKNKCWKQSRGKADFVIVCDIDEFVYHSDIHQAIKLLKDGKYSIVKPYGYNMYSADYPIYDSGQLITDQVKCGVRVPMFDKCILFDPHAIAEINYKPGAHECYPWGRVKNYRNEDIKLLHYKCLGLQQILERNRAYVSRLSMGNKEKGYGAEYLKNEQFIIQEFNENEQKATEII